MSTFSAIDLSQLPKPNAIEALSFETIFESMRQQLSGLQPALFTVTGDPVLLNAELFTAENGEQYYKVPAHENKGLIYLELDSDPSVKMLQIAAYRELLLRQRVNEGAAATMLAFATGPDLDHEAARFGVQRLVIDAGDPNAAPPVPATLENDANLRRRAQLALEGYSVAGPVGAYVYHALTASADVAAVDVVAPQFARLALSPEQEAALPAGAIALEVIDDAGLEDPVPGDVAITVLSAAGDGTATQPLLDAVQETLNSDEIRPLTDRPRVRSAEIISYAVDAELTLHQGPDSSVVLQAAIDAVTAYVSEARGIGIAPTLSGFYRALKQPGVYDVVLNQPAAAITLTDYQSTHCTSINVVIGGVYD